jgi:hypothetical protein
MPTTRRKKKAEEEVAALIEAKELDVATSREQLVSAISYMELEVKRLIESTCKKWEREAMKCVKRLPDKASIQPEIYSMPYSEFILRGGHIDSVTESLKKEKLEQLNSRRMSSLSVVDTIKEDVPPPSLPPSLPPPLPIETTRTGYMTRMRTRATASVTEPHTTVSKPKRQATDITSSDAFKTPACTSLMVASSTIKRVPKQLEKVEVMIKSKATGSPLNEKKTMETILLGMVDECMSSVISTLPKNSKLTAEIMNERMKMMIKENIQKDGEVVFLVTPAPMRLKEANK